MNQIQTGMTDRQNFQNCVPILFLTTISSNALKLVTGEGTGRDRQDHSMFLLPSSQLLVQCVGMWPKQSQSDSAQIFQNQAGNKEILPKQMRTQSHIFCWMNTHLQQKRLKKANVQRSAEKGERTVGVGGVVDQLLISSMSVLPNTNPQEPNPNSTSITCK